MANVSQVTTRFMVPTYQWVSSPQYNRGLLRVEVIHWLTYSINSSYLWWQLTVFLNPDGAIPGWPSPPGQYGYAEWVVEWDGPLFAGGGGMAIIDNCYWPSTTAFQFGTWYEVVSEIDYENGTAKWWRDGILKKTIASTPGTISPARQQTDLRLWIDNAAMYDVRYDDWVEQMNGVIVHQDHFNSFNPDLWDIAQGNSKFAVVGGELKAAATGTVPPGSHWRHWHKIVRANMSLATTSMNGGNQSGNPYRQLFGCYVDSGSNVFLFRRNIAGEPFDETDTGINADEASIERKADGTLILSTVSNNVISHYQSRNQGATWVVV